MAYRGLTVNSTSVVPHTCLRFVGRWNGRTRCTHFSPVFSEWCPLAKKVFDEKEGVSTICLTRSRNMVCHCPAVFASSLSLLPALSPSRWSCSFLIVNIYFFSTRRLQSAGYSLFLSISEVLTVPWAPSVAEPATFNQPATQLTQLVSVLLFASSFHSATGLSPFFFPVFVVALHSA